MNRLNSRSSTPSPPPLTSTINQPITTPTSNSTLNNDSTTPNLNFNPIITTTSSTSKILDTTNENDQNESLPLPISDSPIAFEFPSQPNIISSSSNVGVRKVKRSNTVPYKNAGPRSNTNAIGGGTGNTNTVNNIGNQLEAKVVILGSQGVGKTSLVTRYTTGNFSYSLSSTIGASFLTKKLVVDNTKVRLQIWDTAGQERFRSMAALYYRGALAAIIVYDITNQDTFDDVKVWLEELRRTMSSELLIHVVGSKADLAQSNRAVDLNTARKAIAEWINISTLPSTSSPSTTTATNTTTTTNEYSSYLSPNLSLSTNSRESSPSPRKERTRTMSTRTGGSGGGNNSNPSLKASTSSSSSSNLNTTSNSVTTGSISPPIVSSSSGGNRSRKLSTKNSISVGVSGSTSSASNTTVFASDLINPQSDSTLEGGLSRSGTLLTGNKLGLSLGLINGNNSSGSKSSGSRRGKSVEDERRNQEEEEKERERIETYLRENGIEVSEVSAKDDYGIEDLFLAITSRLVERKSQIETNRILRSRDSFMLSNSDTTPEQISNGWCCT